MEPARIAALNAAAVPAESEVAWTIELLVSELFANAVLHADAPDDDPIELDLRVGSHHIEVGVIDHGAGEFTPSAAMPRAQSATSGRGLALVARLAETWGIERGRGRTRVWFTLALP